MGLLIWMSKLSIILAKILHTPRESLYFRNRHNNNKVYFIEVINNINDRAEPMQSRFSDITFSDNKFSDNLQSSGYFSKDYFST